MKIELSVACYTKQEDQIADVMNDHRGYVLNVTSDKYDCEYGLYAYDHQVITREDINDLFAQIQPIPEGMSAEYSGPAFRFAQTNPDVNINQVNVYAKAFKWPVMMLNFSKVSFTPEASELLANMIAMYAGLTILRFSGVSGLNFESIGKALSTNASVKVVMLDNVSIDYSWESDADYVPGNRLDSSIPRLILLGDSVKIDINYRNRIIRANALHLPVIKDFLDQIAGLSNVGSPLEQLSAALAKWNAQHAFNNPGYDWDNLIADVPVVFGNKPVLSEKVSANQNQNDQGLGLSLTYAFERARTLVLNNKKVVAVAAVSMVCAGLTLR